MTPLNSIPKKENGELNLSVGQVKTLDDESAREHLSQLHKRIRNLTKIAEKGEEERFLVSHLETLQHTLQGFYLKYSLVGMDKIDLPLKITSLNSGFPTEADFYGLWRNSVESRAVLEGLPERQEIIERIGNCLTKSSSVETLQNMLSRFNFYSHLAGSSLFETYKMFTPNNTGEKNGSRYYTIDWSCLEGANHIPVFSKIFMTQDAKKVPLAERDNSTMETIIYSSQMGFMTLNAMGTAIDNNVSDVHPRMLFRYKIGPFYNKNTENSPEMNSLLAESDEPFVLKFTIEKIMSERTKNHYINILDRIRGKKDIRQVFGPAYTETRMIVPFRMKQKLKNRDEFGNPCKVYAVINGGEIV